MTMMAEKPLLIDIGAGNIQLDGYTTIDVVDHFHPDHLAPITSLPFADDTVDGARAAHVLEHLLPVTIAIDRAFSTSAFSIPTRTRATFFSCLKTSLSP